MEGLKKIVNRLSGKALDLDTNYMTVNGGEIQQWVYTSRRNQQWHIIDLGGGSHKILSAQSGFSVDADTGTINTPGTKVHQWQYHGGQNQRWKFQSIGGGWFHIINTQNGWLLDANLFAINQNGADIALYPENGQQQQHWKLEDVELGTSADNQTLAGGEKVNSEFKTEWKLALVSKTYDLRARIEAGLDYKSESFGKTLDVNGGRLMSWVVSEKSSYNVKDFSLNADEFSVTVKGKVYREAFFGGGGGYKAIITANFAVPVQVLTGVEQTKFSQGIQQFRYSKHLGVDASQIEIDSSLAAALSPIGNINGLI